MIWRLLLFEVAIIAVVAAVWLPAPLVGVTSAFWRVMIIVALVVPPVAVLLWKFFSQRRSAKGLESAMRDQARAHQDAVRPDRREEIQLLGDVFNQATRALRRSHLGKSGGLLGGRGTALYALPWYMIIGPPAAGKSTALLRSGLRFPFTPGDRKSVQGVGGTRNCDWWFSDQAILLDTAGRYTAEDDDLDEWMAFLRLLRKYRRRRPLNGLIVAISISDLIGGGREEIEAHAVQIRSRIDQVIGELHVSLPIYVLFTKCDLVSGFIQFFGDLRKSQRAQIFGFTCPLADRQTDIDALFSREFEILLDGLRGRTLTRLAQAKTHERGDVYQFPLQFAAARDPLAKFVGRLLTANPYQEPPRLRGVYFCSGTQEGRPIDRVMKMVSRALGLKELGAEVLEQRAAKKSYFLRELFTDVMVPDRDLVGTTVAARRRRRQVSIASGIGAATLSIAALSLAAVSYSNNRELVESTVQLSKASRMATPDDPRRVTDALKALDRLGARLDLFRRHRTESVPWSLSFGYYQGEALDQPSERVYIKRMRQAFVLPAGSELEATLIDIAATEEGDVKEERGDAARDFDLLKTYLMVSDPARLDVNLAANVLIAQWSKRLHPDVASNRPLLERNATRYLKLVKAKRAGWLDQDASVVRNARHALRARDAEYRAIIDQAERQLRPFTLRDALRGRIQSAITASASVPGVYTRAGWNRYMKRRLATQVVTGSQFEAWVFGETDSGDVATKLRKRYFEQYVAAWHRFLKGLSVRLPVSAAEALQLLERLSEPPPLYKELLEAVTFNTSMPGPDAKKLRGAQRLIRGRAGKALRTARRLKLDQAAAKHRKLNPAETAFLPLHELIEPPEGTDGRAQVGGMQQYFDQLALVRDELAKQLDGSEAAPGALDRVVDEAKRVTKGVLSSLSGELRRALAPLLYRPLDSAAGRARAAHADRTSRAFSDELCGPYRERIAGRYPFDRKATRDALMQDVAEFFGDSGTVWTYHRQNLQSRLPRRGDSFTPAGTGDVPAHLAVFFSRSWQITRALFPSGSDKPKLRFEVRTHPAILVGNADHQVSEIVLEVEGRAQTYRNGPTEQWDFTWTGTGKRSRLLLRGAAGLRDEVEAKGDWSLLRLIDRGKVRKRGSWYEVQWSLKGGQIQLRIDFRPSRSANPLFRPLSLDCR